MSTSNSSIPPLSSPIRNDYGTLSENREWLKDPKKRALLELAKEVSENDFLSTHLAATLTEGESWSPWPALEVLVNQFQKTVDTFQKEAQLYVPLLKLLNSISYEVFQSLPAQNPPRRALVFLTCHEQMIYNPFGGSISPDFVVLEDEASILAGLADHSQNKSFLCPVPKWHALVATGEVKGWRSKGQDAKHVERYAISKDQEAIAQAAKYLLHHLQNRPEQVSVLGFASIGKRYRLFYHDASAIQYSPLLDWTPRTIFAFIRRLYAMPSRDPSMNLVPHPDASIAENLKPIWAIKVDDEVFVAGEARPEMGPGQRRFVAIVRHIETGVEYFVKDIWRNTRGRFIEAELCNKAHKPRQLPGLMSVARFGGVLDEHGDQICTPSLPRALDESVPDPREKARLFTLDVGKRLTTIESALEFLRVMYDACAVQRNMYEQSRVMHRDVSEGNVMVAPADEEFYDRCIDGYDNVKYINQVLPKDPERDEKPRPACLLVDLGHGVDLDEAQSDPKLLAERTGTPKFIARSVSSGALLPFASHQSNLAEMPLLEGVALARYKDQYGDKHYDFYSTLLQATPPKLTATQRSQITCVHRLFHDAESVFWLISWILIRSAPPNSPQEPEHSAQLVRYLRKMQEHRPFNEAGDERDQIMSFDWEGMLHEGLKSLAPMLRDMCSYISPEWAFRTDLEESPEHVHEALMRLLLTEIVRLEEDGDIPIEVEGRYLPVIERFPQLDHNTASQSQSAALGSTTTPSVNQQSRVMPTKQKTWKQNLSETRDDWLASVKIVVQQINWANVSFRLKTFTRIMSAKQVGAPEL